MGSGASRQHHDRNHHPKSLPTPGGESLPSFTDRIQPQMHVQDQRFSPVRDNEEMRKQVKEDRVNTGRKASPSDILETYRVKYPEQAESLKTMFFRLQALKNFVDRNLNHPDEYAKVGEQTIDGLFETSVNTFQSAGTSEAKTFTTLMEFIIDVGGAKELKRFVAHCFKHYMLTEESDEEDENDEETEEYTCYFCLFNTLAAMQNFTDFHQGFCLACANVGVISMCFEISKTIDAENSNWEDGDEDSEPILIIEASIGILHNISRRLRDRVLFANTEQKLLYFAKKTVPAIAAVSLLTLAYLVDENTNHLILADENLLSFIITLLDEAWQSEDRHSNGYSAKELAEGLSHLAINDTNKKLLGQKGVTSVLISVIKTSSDDEEKASATRALWMLAFDDNNKEAIRQEDGAMDILRQLQQSKDLNLQKAAAGALWELEGKTARQAERIETTGNHVMISYQWDSQEVLVEVKNRLQSSGYRVWMDLEQMGGSTLEAMAKAVENATVVLVCVSEQYKESPNCRSEAEYAYQLRKDIIPLMMQRNYRGDGWLGMLVGTKLWFDFQSKQLIHSSVGKLIRELGGRGRDVDVIDGPSEPVVRAVQADVTAAVPSSPGVSTWSNKEVKQWFKEIGLEKVCKEDISEMNGQTLIDLQELREECPDYFYACVERSLKLTDMFDLLKFRKELSKLLRK